MSNDADAFKFVREPSGVQYGEAFLIRIPAGLQEKADLLAKFAREGRFPSYFGRNWDALLDCLGDLSWIAETVVIVEHEDLPLANTMSLCKTYIEVLAAAVRSWAQVPSGKLVSPPEAWDFIPHTLVVTFPLHCEHTIRSLNG